MDTSIQPVLPDRLFIITIGFQWLVSLQPIGFSSRAPFALHTGKFCFYVTD